MSKNSELFPSLRTEIVAGVTTFFTMAYIVVLNPAILSTPGTGMEFDGVMTATVMLCFLLTLAMGLYAKLPFAVAPGMGINAFFTFQVILGKKVPWPVALGVVFWAGVLFLIISVTPLREKIAKAIPGHLRTAAAAGIGIFLTFIGLKNSGIIASDPVTFVRIGLIDLRVGLSVLGLFVMVFLLHRRSPFSFLAGMALVTCAAIPLGLVEIPQRWFSLPDFESVFFKLSPLEALQFKYLPSMVSILFTDLFDSISTFVGVCAACGMLDRKGEPKNLRQGLIVDALATLGAGLFGTSSGTAYIESSAGIEVGGRTGRTAVVTALCFLPCFFIAPIAGMIPGFATAPVLIVVGALMFRSVGQMKFNKIEDVIPAYLTLVLIPLTFSITQGILWGFLGHTALYTMVGRSREIGRTMWLIAVISLVLLFVDRL